tara:strand:+ start:219 stop:437 length:219 start_codon:yes stop_codon:yes gene_type:complete
LNLKKLDLHCLKHHEVAIKVENFVLLNQQSLPLEIVCGKSQKMIEIVTNVLDEIDCENYIIKDFGTIIVRKI